MEHHKYAKYVGILIVGLLPEVDDFVVMAMTDNEVDYTKEPYRIDCFKASYRYILQEP